ncbi:unnamed protein product [Rotaria sp. Silwood1]|nr:unnamed protein product [Rotaria sp. Silwood1]
MNTNVNNDKTLNISVQNKDESLPEVQINPLTLLNSISPFKPIDDNQENILESTCINRSQCQTNDVSASLSDKFDQQNTKKPSSITRMDEHSIAAWVKSTTAESITSPIERSPSLPSTIIEQIAASSRRTSTVSTLCDQQQQQQSVTSDTMSSTLSQNPSISTEIQRSFSFPTTALHQHDDEQIRFSRGEENENEGSSQFLPAPESEDSEVDKKMKNIPSVEEPIQFNARSPIEEQTKNLPSISFDPSISLKTHRKLTSNRKRHNSWNVNKNKLYLYQRSQSHQLSSQSPLLKSDINQKQFLTSPSMPTNVNISPTGNRTNQSSSFSDNVFLSTSTTNSPSSSNHLKLINNSSICSQFLSIPSSTSMLSSDRLTSNISDISGKSGIESSNLRTSASEPPLTASIIEEETHDKNNLFFSKQKQTSSPSTVSSRTASTENLPTSSSENEIHNIHKKPNVSNKTGKCQKTPANQRLDALRQLKWLLEKRSTINPRLNLGRRRHLQGTIPIRSSFRSNNTLNTMTQFESNLSNSSKTSVQLFSSANENSNQVHSLPINSHLHTSTSPSQSFISHIDPLSQSYTSVISMHSDSSLNGTLINTKSKTQSSGTGTISLTSSLHLQRNTTISNSQSQRRRLLQHRRNLSGLAAVQRDRKNSSTKSNSIKIDEHQHVLQTSQQQSTPLVRDTKAILNEHLIMINNLLLNYSFNASIQYPSQNSSIRDFLYTRLNELSLKNPMKQRCSRIETKAFIDSITSYEMNRSHHYKYLINSIRDLLKSNNDPVRLSTCSSETDDDDDIIETKNNIDNNELLNTSVLSVTPIETTEQTSDIKFFKDHPLRFFRTLSVDYIRDCEQTEKDLTQKLFDIADKQHILYCLKHVDSGHTNDLLAIFHRRLDAICVWYNLYYELTISVKKLSGLLRCNDCEDWPKLHFRSLATDRERKAKRADESDDYTSENSSNEDDDEDDDGDTKTTEESEVTSESKQSVIEKTEDGDDTDIMPKICWSDEPLDQFSNLKISDESSHPTTNATTQKLDRTACYRNFVYYMDKRSYQVKYDGLARTLIERVAPVLFKIRLALLQTTDRRDIKIEQVLAGLSLSDFQLSDINKTDSKTTQNTDDIDDKLVDTDNPVTDDNITNINIGELTIEKWLHHVLKSCSTIKIICTHTDDILKQNWLELHEQLGLPSLLPLYFFIINVLLDVMNECLTLYNKPYMNNDIIEIDPLCRQQLVREAKLVLRDALATRLYSVHNLRTLIIERLYEQQQKQKIDDIFFAGNYQEFIPRITIFKNKRKFSSIYQNEMNNIYFGKQFVNALQLSSIGTSENEQQMYHCIFKLDLS